MSVNLFGSQPGTIPTGTQGALPAAWYRDPRDQSPAVAQHPALAAFPEHEPAQAMALWNRLSQTQPAPQPPRPIDSIAGGRSALLNALDPQGSR